MTSLRVSHVLSALTAIAVAIGGASSSHAQVSPGGGLPSGQQGPEPKPEGVAEQAPKAPGALPTTPVLPPPKSKRKEFQLFEMDGYFRFRMDWFKQLNLGFVDTDALPDGGGAPFPLPLGCKAGDLSAQACKGTLRSSNIRLRLEPTLNIDEKASVHFQVDVLDNVVLGSTPDGFSTVSPRPPGLPTGTSDSNQIPPQDLRNSDRDSIAVKRAWAEVMTPLGMLKFGRQPSHWGLGILANAGGHNPFDGSYDLDSDYGDTVDRLQFGALIPGTDLKFAVATDWPTTVVSSALANDDNRVQGQPFDLDDNDDAYQWTFQIARLDTPEEFEENVGAGDIGLNFGGYFVYRKQEFESLLDSTGTPAYVQRGAKLYIPDFWFKFGWGNTRIEGEAVAVLGSINNVEDIDYSDMMREGGVDVQQLGGVLRIAHRFLDNELELGVEGGFASGDDWDARPQGSLDVLDVPAIPGYGDDTASAFVFDPDYKIDLILFRELKKAVSNAAYLRPKLRYDLTDRIRFNAQAVYSMPHRRIATPGNGSAYGLELDGDLGYHNQGFFAGVSYGVLFPMSALDHAGGLGYDPANAGTAKTAQTFQSRLVIQF